MLQNNTSTMSCHVYDDTGRTAFDAFKQWSVLPSSGTNGALAAWLSLRHSFNLDIHSVRLLSPYILHCTDIKTGSTIHTRSLTLCAL